MTDDPFGDLDDDLGDAMETEPEDDTNESKKSTESEESSKPQQSTQSIESTDATQSDQTAGAEVETAPIETPAFPSGNSLNRSIYVRDDTWSEFEDAIDIEFIPGLKRQGADDITKRELHDAALRVALNNPEDVIDQFLDTRGVDK